MTRPRAVDAGLVAGLVATLRRCKRPAPGWWLAGELSVYRLRSIGEAARAARLRGLGVSYVPGRGYVMAKSKAERIACAERMERAARAELRAAAALRRGRVPQTKIPATRVRRAA